MLETNGNVINPTAVRERALAFLAPINSEKYQRGPLDAIINGLRFTRSRSIQIVNCAGYEHEFFVTTLEVKANGLTVARKLRYIPDPEERFETSMIPHSTYGIRGIGPDGDVVVAETTRWKRLLTYTDLTDQRIRDPFDTLYYASRAGVVPELSGTVNSPFTIEEQQRQAVILGILIPPN